MNFGNRIAMAALLMLAGAAAGCQAMAYTASVATPPKRIEALFHLPPGKKVVVFVDDPSGSRADHGVLEKLAGYLEKELTDKRLVQSLVPQNTLQAALVSLGDDGNVHLPHITREVGADLVVYVQVESFGLSDDESRTWQGKMSLLVKVQAVDGRMLWPASPPYPIRSIEYKPKMAIDDEVACKDNITDNLAFIGADRVAKLFYAHPERQLGERDVRRRPE
ncbi:MAG: hypothetical protein NTV86_08230 [Planctomycetota bacterium]|nr:hypothetical protein [Planctomycetota bacterium]